MKVLLGAIAVLMIGAQSAYGVFTDSQGRVCNFGPAHDECQYQFLEKIPGTINNIHYHSGQKVGYVDGLTEGVYHHLTAEDNAPSISWGEGYTHGWSQGCRDSGRTGDDCDSQEDVSTP